MTRRWLHELVKGDEDSEEEPEIYLLVLEGGPHYTEFLRRVLADNKVLSPSQLIAFSVGRMILVVSGGELQAGGRRGVLVRGRVEKMLDKILKLQARLIELVSKLAEEYFPESERSEDLGRN